VGFRAVDGVEADLVLGSVVLSEHCDGVAVCDGDYFAGDWLGVCKVAARRIVVIIRMEARLGMLNRRWLRDIEKTFIPESLP
jgi:regulator of RNase E activity RraA